MTKRTITLSELNLDITYSVKDNSPRGCHTVSGHDLQIGDKIVIDNYFTEIVPEPATEPTEPATEPAKPAKVSISRGNSKMGAIPSVSLPPVITCPKNAPCAKKCYAAKIARLRTSVREAYQNNLDILNEDWGEYWRQVNFAVSMTRFFRFHVAGDIPNAAYFKEMVITARNNPHTEILAFTKQYDIVNNYIDIFGDLPKNLHLIFSRWDSAWNVHIHNPHDLPMSAVIFKNVTNQPDYEKICGGNCTECACRGVGCWELKKGETIAFYEH